ncbi:MAG TPA: 3-hydroxyacyl-CoA dehydrogenase NAD-binding domain-containing protein [Chitinophagaceae bacterium]|nr:3-hydroxyacyl-CoA dehydrogenase NAD-binding domain-containing protein [Chitinophagaceae bacterium]
MQSIQSICVCGAGTMGSGIAQLCAQSGFPTILYDLDPSILQKAKAGIEKNWQLGIEKGKLSEAEKERADSLLKFTGNISDCVADLIIEAIIEIEEIKVSLFHQLENLNGNNCILATNTSSLSVTAIAERTKHKEHVIGLHFFNPAPLMRLVEIVKTKYNSQTIIDATILFAKQLGKTVVVCRDAPGFIVNHVARPYYIEALNLVESGFSDFETIDELMESSGFKMGPFKLMDLIGNDVNYAVSCSVYEAMGKPERLKPSPIQKEKVEKGELGRKTKKGYYSY